MRNAIKELREARGWPQAKLGERMAPPVTRQYVSQLEKRDVRGLTVDLVIKVADALGCSRDDVIGLATRGAGATEPDACLVREADLPDLNIRLAKLLYPQGDAATMIVMGHAVILEGLAPGMRILVDRAQKPADGNIVVVEVRGGGDAGPATLLRLYRPPFLLPAAADSRHAAYAADDPRVNVAGVIVASYCQPEVRLGAIEPLHLVAAAAAAA